MNDVNAVVLAQAYMKEHHMDAEFGIERVCRAVGYSRRQLDRLFQKQMRMTLYAPTFNLGADPKIGARIAIPAIKNNREPYKTQKEPMIV